MLRTFTTFNRFLVRRMYAVSILSTLHHRGMPVDVLQDMAGLPFLSFSKVCFLTANMLYVTEASTNTSNGIIITIKYNAAEVSLQRTAQCGFTSIAMPDHWQDQLWSV